jgi:hypothetical protein
MSDEPEEDISIEVSRSLVLAIFAGIFLLWIATPFLVRTIVPESLEQRAHLGELYGVFNALFSGLAFAGVILAILLQRKELALQRRELQLTRQELRRAAIAQDQAQAQAALNKTIYAHSLKVALDFIESPDVLRARSLVNSVQSEFERLHPVSYSAAMTDNADLVYRSFEAVGIMVRKGLLPEDYILDTWGNAILRYWRLLRLFIEFRRKDRSDPAIGRDFELLAAAAQRFIEEGEVSKQ